MAGDYLLTVLKFGSSVLRSENDFGLLVEEIHRWLSERSRVIAVVSAIGETTDRLMNQAVGYGENFNQEGVATLASTGELASAALLTLALGKAGIAVTILDPARLRLLGTGPLLNAELTQVDEAPVRLALTQFSVAVVPGFIARSADGRTALLGRGGSDLTALFLAHGLRAGRCRLLKDVDGLYESDPNADTASQPRRYRNIHWQDALRLKGTVVQHKGIRYAARQGQAFEVAAPGGNDGTNVGDFETKLYGH
jgi:homoserine dehydrogenase